MTNTTEKISFGQWRRYFVGSILIVVILLVVGMALAGNPDVASNVIVGFKFLANAIGAVLTVFGIVCLMTNVFGSSAILTFGRSLSVVLLGMSIFALSGLFAIGAVIPYSVELFLESRNDRSKQVQAD